MNTHNSQTSKSDDHVYMYSSYNTWALILFHLPRRLPNNASRICNKQDSRHIRSNSDMYRWRQLFDLLLLPINFRAWTTPSYISHRLSSHGHYRRFFFSFTSSVASFPITKFWCQHMVKLFYLNYNDCIFKKKIDHSSLKKQAETIFRLICCERKTLFRLKKTSWKVHIIREVNMTLSMFF